ncbi:MAG: DNA mismatch repair endonuclease MutL, partial [Candidatus Caldarchaeum sp.]
MKMKGSGIIFSVRRIQVLDPQTINQIAAGEVVERPASVVKELVENSLDAGARRIEIEVRGAGKELIRVSDDGCGMSEEDAYLSLERHATSKIRLASDLRKVATLGFRGEALPSIASVSRLRLGTGEADGERVVLEIEFGKLVYKGRSSGARGTEVQVQDLFGNTPARLKFLKSDSTELATIADVIGKYVVAHPHVAFTLILGNSTSLASSGNGNRLEALAEVWGYDLARALAEI